jgi:hypothetical protein
MLEFQKKKKLQSTLYSKFTIFVLLVLTIVMIKATWNVFWKARESQLNLEKITRETNNLQDRKESLTSSIEQFDTSRGREAEIRDKFRVAKQGEELIVLLDSPENKPTEVIEKSLWQKFLGLFKD